MSHTRTIQQMICEDLGYCCEAAFFTLYKKPSIVADRLGVTPRAVRTHRSKVRSGEEQCRNCPNCLARTGTALAKKLKRPTKPT